MCRVCGQLFKRINISHVLKHGMDMLEYRQKYLNAPIVCVATCITYRKTNSGQFKKGGKSWNRNLTKETSAGVRRMSETKKERYASGETIHHFLGKKFSDEHRKNISRAFIGRVISEETRRRISVTLTGRKHSPEAVEKIRQAHRDGVYDHTHKLSWNRGLTKDTDPRVAKNADAIRAYFENGGEVWSQNLTKETHLGIASGAVKRTGRTKETHLSHAAQSVKLRAKWQDPEWVKTLSVGGWGSESNHHTDLKKEITVLLQDVGWTVILEKWIIIDGEHYRVDIWAIRNDRKIVVEVGGCSNEKLTNLWTLYGPNNVFHIPYGEDEKGLEKLMDCTLLTKRKEEGN